LVIDYKRVFRLLYLQQTLCSEEKKTCLRFENCIEGIPLPECICKNVHADRDRRWMRKNTDLFASNLTQMIAIVLIGGSLLSAIIAVGLVYYWWRRTHPQSRFERA
jgi:hypothetical protein